MATANTRVVNGINTRVLHNKDYVEVNERVNILHRLRKSGEIKDFEMVESQPYQFGDRLVWRVSARIDGKLYIGNAEAKMDAPKNSPDGTNPFECAETSAFGRMLAFAGLGTVESIASYDEIMRGQPFTAVIEQRTNGVVEAGNVPQQIEAPKRTPLVQAMLDAREAGMISGSTKEERTASWEEWVIMIFGKQLEASELNKPANIAKINATIQQQKMKQAS